MKETFGEYIKRLRTENELTLTQLAAKLDYCKPGESYVMGIQVVLDSITLP